MTGNPCVFHKETVRAYPAERMNMKRDLVDYAYLSDNLRYADLFNGVLFGGEEIVSAKRLKGEDSKLVEAFGKDKKGRYRDVIRKYEGDINYAVLGIENQEAVDYTMPLRIMEYETGEYMKQLRELQRRHEQLKDVTGAEYLCKFKRDDRLHPCITLVLYWGDNWDGARSLKEMINMEELPEVFRAYVRDYPMHLVNIKKFEDTDVFKTDLKLVFDFMKHTRDSEGMRRLLLENEEYKSVSRDAYEIMRAHTNLAELDMLLKEDDGEKKEVVDMCQAIREIIEEECEIARAKAIQEGLAQGMEKGILEGRERGRAEGRAEGKAEGKEGILQGMLLQTYRMVERGKLSIADALDVLEFSQSEDEFVEGLIAAGYSLP